MLVLCFIDPVIIAERVGDTGEAVIDRIVRELQRITEKHNIDYLKIISDQIVAVEGFSGDSSRQAAAVIETALAIRDYCTRTFSRMAESPEFAMGIDTGMVIGSPVGFGSHAYNVWGETVRVASAMAASAPSGSIQFFLFHLPPCCRPVPVPRPRRLLPGAVRRDVDLCADGATVIQQANSGSPAAPAVAAPVRTLSALSPRRLLAAIGRPPLSLLRRLAMAAGFGAAVAVGGGTANDLAPAGAPRAPPRHAPGGRAGVRATLVIGVLIGLAMVYQALYWLQAAGQTGLLGRVLVLVLVLVREIAPLVAGLIIVGRSGLPMLIHLEELRAGGQLRMLEAQGIDPFLLLVVPSVLAFALSCYCLSMLLLTTALLVGYFTGHAVGAAEISLYAFFDTLLRAMAPAVKTLAIDFAVGVTCALPVLTAVGSSDIGRLTASGFVQAVLAVFVVSGAVSVML